MPLEWRVWNGEMPIELPSELLKFCIIARELLKMGPNFVSAKMILDSALLFILFSVLFPCQFAFASVGSKMITVDQETTAAVNTD
jgi:hypothetical protein